MPVRDFAPADIPAVDALHRSVGWPVRSAAGWTWLRQNPAQRATGAPLGYVLADDQDRPAAFLGNLVQGFRQGERTVYGATGFSLIVPPEKAGRSRGLVKALMTQPGMFAHYTFNANPAAARIYDRIGLEPWPVGTHALKLSWIIDPLVCAAGRGLRQIDDRWPGLTPRLGERLMNRRLGQGRPLRLPAGVTVLTDVTDSSPYAAFWQALVAEGRLVADRSPAMLRWRLTNPDVTTAPLALACSHGGRVVGHALAVLAKDNAISPPVLEVIDLIALEGHPEAVASLMQAMIEAAPTLGAAKVRLQVVSPRLLSQLGGWERQARREGGWGHGHATFAADGLDPAGWSPTPLDGDYLICLRPVPVSGSPVP